MKEYRVLWEIEVTAESPKEAVKRAREIQLDPESIATVFEVSEVPELIDLDPESEGSV